MDYEKAIEFTKDILDDCKQANFTACAENYEFIIQALEKLKEMEGKHELIELDEQSVLKCILDEHRKHDPDEYEPTKLEYAKAICSKFGTKKESQWISVEDGLPEIKGEEWYSSSDRIIVSSNNNVTLMKIQRTKVRGKIVERFEDMFGMIFRGNITHWQPLPEPPKEKS